MLIVSVSFSFLLEWLLEHWFLTEMTNYMNSFMDSSTCIKKVM